MKSTKNSLFTYKHLLVGSDTNSKNANLYSKTISINRVSDSLHQFYQSILDTNTVIQYILQKKELIHENGFENILRPFANNQFYENESYFSVFTVPKFFENTIHEKDILQTKCLYTFKKYDQYTNQTIQQLIKRNKNGKFIYFPDEGIQLLKAYQESIKYMDTLKKIGIDSPRNYFVKLETWEKGIVVVYECLLYIPNILPPSTLYNSDFVTISSFIRLNRVIQDIDQIQLFSPEYVEFMKTISNRVLNLQIIYNHLLQKSSLYPVTMDYDVWEYTYKLPSASICYYSSKFPDWKDKNVQWVRNPLLPINFADLIDYIFTMNSKELLLTQDQQVGIIEYHYNQLDYVFLTKIISIKDRLYLIINTVETNTFFNPAFVTNGDVGIEGSLTVDQWNGKNVLNVHTENETLQINGKIGINIQEPTALLDIQSISTNEIQSLLKEYGTMNLFLFRCFDYFDNQYANTPNRNWNEIYQGFFENEKVSVTTLLLPFDLWTTESQDISFSSFMDTFNDHVYLNMTELPYQSKYQGKTASQLVLQYPYMKNYFFDIKDYFLLLWNQKSFFRRNKYQTFTNIVNYFEGPVLRMQLMWYDPIEKVLRLFSTNLSLNQYLLNENLRTILESYFNSMFACEQLVNLASNLLLDPVIMEKTKVNRMYITEYINNSYYKQRFGYTNHYLFCYNYTPFIVETQFFFHEAFSYWYDQKTIQLQIPNQDILVSYALDQINAYISKNFDASMYERIMVAFYYWQFEYKTSYTKMIEMDGKPFILGSGVNLLDYIKKNIISNGDQQFNGSLRILDTFLNQTVVSLDTAQKQIAMQYPLALGTENPRSLLTIDDVSITNVFQYLDELSKTNRYLSDVSKQLKKVSSSRYQTVIDSYINPFTQETFTQDNDQYFMITDFAFPDYTDILKWTQLYHWYIPEWTNETFQDILSPTFNSINNKVKPLFINAAKNQLTTSMLSLDCFTLDIYDWSFGKKIRSTLCFNDTTYLAMGINLNQYFSRLNSNQNLQTILQAIQAIQCVSNQMFFEYLGTKPINDTEFQLFWKQIQKEYKVFSTWIMDFPKDIQQTRLYLTPSGTLPTTAQEWNYLMPTDTIQTMIYQYDTSNHGSLTFEQILSFYQKVVNLHLKIEYYNGDNLSHLDSNIIGYRTDTDYWISNWMYNESQKWISIIEFNVDDYLNQTIQMIGDLQMAGNLTLMDAKQYLRYVKKEIPLSALETLISIYPEENFIGIGSQHIYSQYPIHYETLDQKYNKILAKNHMVVSNSYYPNLVAERFADHEEDVLSSSFSSLTVRRSSRIFTMKDMVEKSQGKYGFDISYEIQDKYEDTYEIANTGIRLNGLKTFKNGIEYPTSTFFWSIVDDNKETDNTVDQKTIMELDHKGTLHVDKIRLGDYDLQVVRNSNGTQTLRWGSIPLGTQ